jgi:hypothetical protein
MIEIILTPLLIHSVRGIFYFEKEILLGQTAQVQLLLLS